MTGHEHFLDIIMIKLGQHFRTWVCSILTKMIAWQPWAFSLELIGRHRTATRTLDDSPLAMVEYDLQSKDVGQ